MAEFTELSDDPYTNSTGKFVIVVGITQVNTPTPSSGAWSHSNSGIVQDPEGNQLSYFHAVYLYESSLASGPLTSVGVGPRRAVIPPAFTFKSFGRAIAFIVPLEELPSWL